MSAHDHLEPTNEQLWPQPPGAPHSPNAQPVGQAMVPQQSAPVPATSSRDDRFKLAIISMALGIPISAIAGGNAGLPGILVAWVAIVAVNFIYSWRRP